ncbi:MAG: hypothetical protein IPH85_07625 [Ignavibacteria bacterium]|nr:hypothetical protein [Ignavibacteria bacterium]
MTRLLSIETSGSVCSVAVSVDGSLVSSIEILQANVHDEMLSKCVHDVVSNAGLALDSIDVVAVSAGPGHSPVFVSAYHLQRGFVSAGNQTSLLFLRSRHLCMPVLK